MRPVLLLWPGVMVVLAADPAAAKKYTLTELIGLSRSPVPSSGHRRDRRNAVPSHGRQG